MQSEYCIHAYIPTLTESKYKRNSSGAGGNRITSQNTRTITKPVSRKLATARRCRLFTRSAGHEGNPLAAEPEVYLSPFRDIYTSHTHIHIHAYVGVRLFTARNHTSPLAQGSALMPARVQTKAALRLSRPVIIVMDVAFMPRGGFESQASRERELD